VTTKPRKKRTKRLSEHARLVEARAASIPPRVVHELFDTASVPQPPVPAPRRSVSPAAGRLTSKPPPPPPRPSHAPDDDIPEADLDELEGSEELASDAIHEAHEDSDATRGYETQTQTFIPTVSPRAGELQALRPPQRRSALPAVVLGSLAALGLGLAMFAERSRTEQGTPAVVATEPAPPLALAPPEPVAPALPEPGPLPTEPPGSPPAAEPTPPVAEPSVAEPAPSVAIAAAAGPALPSPPAEVDDLPEFDAELASAAIRSAFVRAQSCRSGSDPTGLATVSVTYAPSGRVTRTLVDGTFAGTSTGSCIAATLRSAAIPPFSGALVTVKRSAEIK